MPLGQHRVERTWTLAPRLSGSEFQCRYSLAKLTLATYANILATHGFHYLSHEYNDIVYVKIKVLKVGWLSIHCR